MMVASSPKRAPGTPLALAVLVPRSARETQDELHALLAGDELLASLFQDSHDEEGWSVIAGSTSWSALVAWGECFEDVAEEIAEALAGRVGETVYVLGLRGWDDPALGSPFVEAHDGRSVERLRAADEGEPGAIADPFAFARGRLGVALPPYRAGVWPREPRDDLRTIPFAALGASRPRRAAFAVRLAGPDTIDALAGGAIDPWQGAGIQGEGGAPGGLFDEQVFGRLRRDPEGRLRLGPWLGEEPRDRPQSVRFGALVLPRALVHPWVLRACPGSGEQTEVLFDLAYLRKVWHEGSLTPPWGLPDDAEVLAGADAIVATVRSGGLPPSVLDGLIRTLPVLPAGLRPYTEDGDGLFVHDATILYELVLRHVARLERTLDHRLPRSVVWTELTLLQRAVDALFVDGAHSVEDPERGTRWVPSSPDAAPEVASLRHMLVDAPEWVEAVNESIRMPPDRPLSKRWSGPSHLHRALLEAAALELVPLRDDGAVDEVAYQTSLVDRRAQVFDDVYRETLGAMYERVIHVDDRTPNVPHIDVHATAPRSDGTRLLLTAGASGRRVTEDPLMADGPRRFELAMVVPASLEPALVEHLMVGLRALARYPFANATALGPLHSVTVGRPIAPMSALTAFVFAEPIESQLFDSLSRGLPGEPPFLLAVGITDAELDALSRADDREGMVSSLLRATRGETDPARR